jgi:AhpD family alkylhydroperoxidase
MCCSTGVCGPSVDPALVRFAADLKWLEDQGAEVERFNLSQTPAAFVENELVRQALTDQGDTALPMVVMDGKVLSSGRYPDRDELASWVKLTPTCADIYSPAVNELVAIGAAIAANCEPCLKFHYREAQKLGVTKSGIARAVEMGAKVKDSPHRAILKLAGKLTGASLAIAEVQEGCCSEAQGGSAEDGRGGKCCG